ncbi:MAG: triose-phosphate isomerase [Pseudomonadota bacterium]
MRGMVVGNWKMNGLAADLGEIGKLRIAPRPECEMVVCAPATLVARMAQMAAGSHIAIGGQDCHWAERGAHTGDVSAPMLLDAGATHVILGHSERRADHAETSALVARKTLAAQLSGLTAIVCVGESEAERDAGHAVAIVLNQLAASLPEDPVLDRLVIAYEPVWAIGTGRTPSLADIGQMHGALRDALLARFDAAGRSIRILYGGSVKPANAAEIFDVTNVNGGLIGGASLVADDLSAIAALCH